MAYDPNANVQPAVTEIDFTTLNANQVYQNTSDRWIRLRTNPNCSGGAAGGDAKAILQVSADNTITVVYDQTEGGGSLVASNSIRAPLWIDIPPSYYYWIKTTTTGTGNVSLTGAFTSRRPL